MLRTQTAPQSVEDRQVARLAIFKTEKWRNYAKNAKIVKIVKVLLWRSLTIVTILTTWARPLPHPPRMPVYRDCGDDITDLPIRGLGGTIDLDRPRPYNLDSSQ
jgi:hypothetical protein